jgi:hypothetical protein
MRDALSRPAFAFFPESELEPSGPLSKWTTGKWTGVLSSAASKETASDGSGKAMSPFCEALARGLTSGGDLSRSHGGLITMTVLHGYLQTAFKDNPAQTPVLTSGTLGGTADFIFEIY